MVHVRSLFYLLFLVFAIVVPIPISRSHTLDPFFPIATDFSLSRQLQSDLTYYRQLPFFVPFFSHSPPFRFLSTRPPRYSRPHSRLRLFFVRCLAPGKASLLVSPRVDEFVAFRFFCRIMALELPSTGDRKRVKVYELRDNDWFDRGTGFCLGHALDVCVFFSVGGAVARIERFLGVPRARSCLGGRHKQAS